MAEPSGEALVEPALLKWARERARMTESVAADKIGIEPARLLAWESGTEKPSVAKLKELARVYKQPLAVFYLPKPPMDFQPIEDYRRIDPTKPGESPELAFAIRFANSRREIAVELAGALEEAPPTFGLTASLSDDVEALAARVRTALGVTLDEQLSWKDAYSALGAWRLACESAGLLVFQFSKVPVSEARALSISGHPFPVIAMNSADAPNARIFSILHEIGHVLLNSGGVCDFEGDRREEVFCNRFAGEALVPSTALTAALQKYGSPSSDEAIVGLSRRFKVSEEVVVRRLLTHGLVTREFYEQKRAEYRARAKRSTGELKIPWPVRVLATGGRRYARLVLDALHRDVITLSDVADYLDTKVKHLRTIEGEVYGKPSLSHLGGGSG